MLHKAADIVVTFFFMVHLPAVTLKYGVGIVWDLGFISLFRTYCNRRHACTNIELHSTAVGFFFSK
jgi:hypothetical protein